MKSIFSLAISLVMLLTVLPAPAAADTKKPDGRRWVCTTINGERTCHRKGERCTLSKSGKSWVCDGPVTTSRRRIPVRTHTAKTTPR